jgi:hypothetical protein
VPLADITKRISSLQIRKSPGQCRGFSPQKLVLQYFATTAGPGGQRAVARKPSYALFIALFFSIGS